MLIGNLLFVAFVHRLPVHCLLSNHAKLNTDDELNTGVNGNDPIERGTVLQMLQILITFNFNFILFLPFFSQIIMRTYRILKQNLKH